MDSVPPVVICNEAAKSASKLKFFHQTDRATTICIAMEERTRHAHHFGFHFADAGKDVGMQWIRVRCLSIHFCNQCD